MPVNPTNHYPTVFLFPVHNELNNVDSYNATRRAWKVSETFRNMTNAIAVGLAGGIAQGVFSIENWQPDLLEPGKYAFSGHALNDPDLVNRNYSSIVNGCDHWKFGNYIVIEFNGQGGYRFFKGQVDKHTIFPL